MPAFSLRLRSGSSYNSEGCRKRGVSWMAREARAPQSEAPSRVLGEILCEQSDGSVRRQACFC
jgi:hypothetical protein